MIVRMVRQGPTSKWHLSRDLDQVVVQGIHVPRGGAFQEKETANVKVWMLDYTWHV